jgi:23S rRNA pseudouridine2605 synthase
MARPKSSKPPRKGSGTSFGKRSDAEKSYRKGGASSRRDDSPRFNSKPSGYRKSDPDARASRPAGKSAFHKPTGGKPRDIGESFRTGGAASSGDRKFSKPYRSEGSSEKRPYRKAGSSFGSRPDGDSKTPYRRSEGESKRPERGEGFTRPEKSDSGEGIRKEFKKPFARKDYGKNADPDARPARAEGDSKRPYERRDGAEKPRDFRSIQDKKSFGKEERKSFVQSRVTTVADFTKPTKKSSSKKEEPKEEIKKDDGLTRLNKYIANSGVGSRREADKLITMGLISVNGTTITELGSKVKSGDVVRYEDRILKAEKPVYILLNKPKGFITTTDDPQERNTVMNLVAGACKERIYPVGRLDRNTTGLLLLTNDGDLADKLTHPSYKAKKVYKVELDKPLTKSDFQKIMEGVRMEEGRAMVDDLAIISEDNKTIGLEIHIGWNRVVRRIFETLGYDVLKLDRSVYAGLDKKDTPRGQWRFLKAEEIVALKHFK